MKMEVKGILNSKPTKADPSKRYFQVSLPGLVPVFIGVPEKLLPDCIEGVLARMTICLESNREKGISLRLVSFDGEI